MAFTAIKSLLPPYELCFTSSIKTLTAMAILAILSGPRHTSDIRLMPSPILEFGTVSTNATPARLNALEPKESVCFS